MNCMKLKNVLPLLVVLALGCRREKADVLFPEGEGSCEVAFQVKPDYTLHDMVLTRAQEQPALEDFGVRLENTRAEVLREWKYEEVPSLIKVVPGAYKLVAWQGTDSIYPAFEAPYYYGETKMTLKEGDNLDTVVNVGLAAVKVAVAFDESFDFEYEDYFVEVKTTGDSLRFLRDETRTGYFKPGNLRLRFGLKLRGENVYREFYPGAIGNVTAKSFCRMKLSAACENGALKQITITTDASTINIPVEVDLPVFFLSKGAPKVTLSGVENGGALETTEGVSRAATILVSAAGGLTELKVKTVSDTLIARGWPAEVDLMSATEEQKAVLRENGLQWSEELDAKKEVKSLVWVKFDRVVKGLNTAPRMTSETRFTVTTKDKFDQTGNEVNFGVQVAPPVFEFVGEVGAGNVWAKRAVYDVKYISERETPVVECQGGDGVWRALETTRTAIESEENAYECVGKGLASNTEYAYRVRLGGHTLDAGRYRTEEELQVPNSGFEEWYEERLHKASGTGGKDIYVFYPYGQSASSADRWWNTRNLTTTQKLTSTWYYAMYPGTVPTAKQDWMAMNHLNRFDGKSFNLSGYRVNAMEIATIGWGKNNWSVFGHNADRKTAGVLYIGSYDVNTHTEQYGYAFNSRPLAVKFYYKFYSYNSEATKAYAEIKDKDGNRIGYGELKITDTADAYKEGGISLSYLQLERAASISIVFLSTDAENPATKDIQGSANAFSGYGDSRHIGSILTVDEVELIYE